MTITRSQAPVLLEPKLSNIWFDAYPIVPIEYTAYLNVRQTQKATVTDFKMTDFGSMRLKGEGENIIYDDPIFGQTIAYVPVRWGLGYKVTDEMLKNELYGQIEKLERSLIKSAVDNQEVTSALIFNNGFGTTDADGFEAAGFDSLALFSTAHTRLDGGATQRNRPSTDVDLGVTALQNAFIDIDNWLDDRGRPIFAKPRLLIVNPEDRYTAKELLQSEYKPGTANNEINAIKGEVSFMVSHYLTDSDAWFVSTDQHDMNFIWEERLRAGMQEDFDAEVIKRKVIQGFAIGHGEWRGIWGTSGG